MGRYSRYSGNSSRYSLIKIIGLIVLGYFLFSLFLVGLTPGHTWLMIGFALFALFFIKHNHFFTLGILLLAALVLFAGGPVSDRIEAVGRMLPQWILAAAKQNVKNTAEHKDPTSALRQGTQIASQRDQQALNACLQQVAHEYAQDVSKGGAGETDLVANEAKFCAAKGGSDFTSCMNQNVFNGAHTDADIAADQCAGASNGTFANTQSQINSEVKGVTFAVMCVGAKLLNKLPGVQLPTSACPD